MGAVLSKHLISLADILVDDLAKAGWREAGVWPYEADGEDGAGLIRREDGAVQPSLITVGDAEVEAAVVVEEGVDDIGVMFPVSPCPHRDLKPNDRERHWRKGEAGTNKTLHVGWWWREDARRRGWRSIAGGARVVGHCRRLRGWRGYSIVRVKLCEVKSKG